MQAEVHGFKSVNKFYKLQHGKFPLESSSFTLVDSAWSCALWNENMARFIIISSCFVLPLIPRVYSGCINSVSLTLTGGNVTDIPRDLPKNLTTLSIHNTKITVFNLTTAIGHYPDMCKIKIESPSVNHIVVPINPTESGNLKELKLARANFPTLPDFGSVLAGQLEVLNLSHLKITTVPNRYFQNYSSLIKLGMTYNSITSLTAEQLFGLGRLQLLNLRQNNLNSFPPVYQWLPNLQRLEVDGNSITGIPIPLLENLPHLQVFDATNNRIQTVPDQRHFINLKNMTSIDLRGNPWHCDYQLCWIKVNVLRYPKSHFSCNVVVCQL